MTISRSVNKHEIPCTTTPPTMVSRVFFHWFFHEKREDWVLLRSCSTNHTALPRTSSFALAEHKTKTSQLPKLYHDLGCWKLGGKAHEISSHTSMGFRVKLKFKSWTKINKMIQFEYFDYYFNFPFQLYFEQAGISFPQIVTTAISIPLTPIRLGFLVDLRSTSSWVQYTTVRVFLKKFQLRQAT